MSKNDEWRTPVDLYNELNKEFNFDLDACASKEYHLCDSFYTKDNSSLTCDWDSFNSVFINPPYSNIGPFVKKAYESKTTVVMLVPSRTDVKWFHEYVINKAEIRFIKGRLRFSDSKSNCPFACMIIVFRQNKELTSLFKSA